MTDERDNDDDDGSNESFGNDTDVAPDDPVIYRTRSLKDSAVLLRDRLKRVACSLYNRCAGHTGRDDSDLVVLRVENDLDRTYGVARAVWFFSVVLSLLSSRH